MKKYLNCILSLALCILAISPVTAGNLKGGIGTIEPMSFRYTGVIMAECDVNGYLAFEKYGVYKTTKRVVDYYYSEIFNLQYGEIDVALPSADTYIDHVRDFYLVVVFPDGSEGNVVISDNIIDYEITEIVYPRRKVACPYRDEFIERS